MNIMRLKISNTTRNYVYVIDEILIIFQIYKSFVFTKDLSDKSRPYFILFQYTH